MGVEKGSKAVEKLDYGSRAFGLKKFPFQQLKWVGWQRDKSVLIWGLFI